MASSARIFPTFVIFSLYFGRNWAETREHRPATTTIFKYDQSDKA